MAGELIDEFAPKATLLGVAPHCKLRGVHSDPFDPDAAAPERHHRHIIGSTGRCWGDESTTLLVA